MRLFLSAAVLGLTLSGCFTFISFDEQGAGAGASGQGGSGGATSTASQGGMGGSASGGGGVGGGATCPPLTDGCAADPCEVASLPAAVNDLEATGCDVAFTFDQAANSSQICWLLNGAKADPINCKNAPGTEGVVAAGNNDEVFYSPQGLPGGLYRCDFSLGGMSETCAPWPSQAPETEAFNGLTVSGTTLWGIRKTPTSQLVSFDIMNAGAPGPAMERATVPSNSHTIRISGGRALLTVYENGGGADGCVFLDNGFPGGFASGTTLACEDMDGFAVPGQVLNAALGRPDGSDPLFFSRAFKDSETTTFPVNNQALPEPSAGRSPGIASDGFFLYDFGNDKLRRTPHATSTPVEGPDCATPGHIALTRDYVFYTCGMKVMRLSKAGFPQ